jgi:hypothetical protein
MAEQAQDSEKVSLPAKLVFILLAGALSMFFAEVLSGSSVLWFINPAAWLLTFWLYLAHTVLFVNLALIFKRASLTSLYLWGVFFGLYEAWITKVTWAGYIGQAPGAGTFLGFAVIEFPLIVFFWHPVMSFILPVLSFEALSGENNFLPGHRQILTKTRRNWLLALFVVIIGASCLSFNAKGSILATDISIIGSVALIGILYWIASKKYGRQFSIESLKLGNIGMAILIVYLALLYSLTFFFLVPERMAPPLTILLTLGVYAVIALLLYVNGRDRPAYPVALAGKGVFSIKEMAILLAVLTALATALCLLMPADQIVIIIVYFTLYAASFILLAISVVSAARNRQKMAYVGA